MGSFFLYFSVANGEPPIGIPWETFRKYIFAYIASHIMKGVIYMLDLDLFDALETMSLMDDYEFEKIRLKFEKNGYILKRDKNENGDTDITVEKK